MTRRTLGSTSLRVSSIGLGCWQFSQDKGYTQGIWAVLDQETIDAIRAWFDSRIAGETDAPR